jgi:hypothetical protein
MSSGNAAASSHDSMDDDIDALLGSNKKRPIAVPSVSVAAGSERKTNNNEAVARPLHARYYPGSDGKLANATELPSIVSSKPSNSSGVGGSGNASLSSSTLGRSRLNPDSKSAFNMSTTSTTGGAASSSSSSNTRIPMPPSSTLPGGSGSSGVGGSVVRSDRERGRAFAAAAAAGLSATTTTTRAAPVAASTTSAAVAAKRRPL